MTDPVIMRPSREQLLEQALLRLTGHIPSTKGMDPKTRAQRLHAELERRIALAKDALRIDGQGNDQP